MHSVSRVLWSTEEGMIHCDGTSEETLLTLTLQGEKGEQRSPGGDLVSVPRLISDLMGMEQHACMD